jgi:hypothetical protein
MLHRHAPERLVVALRAIVQRVTQLAASRAAAESWAAQAARLTDQVEAGAELQVAFDAIGAACRVARAVNDHSAEIERQNADYAAAADGFI